MTRQADRVGQHRLRTFDKESRKLISEMEAAGWVKRMTKNGEAFLYAPDGVTATTVSRDSKRGRSGRNARAFFERWKKGKLQHG